jgi:hypothetical protein
VPLKCDRLPPNAKGEAYVWIESCTTPNTSKTTFLHDTKYLKDYVLARHQIPQRLRSCTTPNTSKTTFLHDTKYLKDYVLTVPISVTGTWVRTPSCVTARQASQAEGAKFHCLTLEIQQVSSSYVACCDLAAKCIRLQNTCLC